MDLIANFPNLPPAIQQQILNGPGLEPPEGVTPDFSKPGNRPAVAISVSVLCLTLVTLSVVARGYSRFVVQRRIKLEDFLGIAAFGGYVGMAWGFYTQLHYGGFFVNQWNVRFGDLQKIIPSALLFTILYAVTMVFVKPAILLEWTHIFVLDREHRAFYRVAHMIIVLNVLLYVSGIIASTAACIPLHALWEPWIRGKCINKKALDIATAYFNVVVDIFIFLLPQKIIWNLQMAKNKKIGVSIIFSFGILSIVCAAGRIFSGYKVKYAGEGDTNYTLSESHLWAFSEVSCVLLVFNITAIPRLLPATWTSSWLPGCFRYWTTVYSRKKSVENHEMPVIWPRPVDVGGLVGDYTQAQLTIPRPTIPIRLDTTYRRNANQAGVSYFCRTESENSDDIIIQRPGSSTTIYGAHTH